MIYRLKSSSYDNGTLVFSHLNPSGVTKTWKKAADGTRVAAESGIINKGYWNESIEVVVLEGPAIGFRVEARLEYLLPCSALEMLAEAAE